MSYLYKLACVGLGNLTLRDLRGFSQVLDFGAAIAPKVKLITFFVCAFEVFSLIPS